VVLDDVVLLWRMRFSWILLRVCWLTVRLSSKDHAGLKRYF
jgi:hypothetical protein